ncbi:MULTISPECIES: acyl-CoA dehydrogenase family protein [unclassified Streptomyces]|uniref:acyl-CoA dehydrogenase family protein n=1 Tax=unclassified Streptomyces TaxID=2593676 RepID=UPI001611C602|nr:MULTISPECIES: acyl-CoA dehydrogenase family protein [unclassified Streptomyces]MBQ0864842.1 acyl-CoA dehydrogenase [Streptomyces sp. RK75]MBQ1122844.1 acyl-CoA dehydrogenase [Streptomyces sp. B15]
MLTPTEGTGGTGAEEELRIQYRIADLERRFGDPADPDNPLGITALLAADERGELLAEAEDVLTDFQLNAEFVPREWGGRLERVDTMGRVLRAVFRRDASLGLGYGATSFLAAVAVWAAGTREQRRRVAELLLSGGRLAIAYHELAHGNDFVRNEFRATPTADGGFRLDGVKQVINNVVRAEALVLFSRTDEAAGSRSHSVLLVEKDRLPAGRLRYLPRYATVGVRGCQNAGVEFTDCPVAGDALVGELGDGVELALRSFQITRSVVPSMILGGGDTALRTAVSFALNRQLYNRSVLEIPHARATLVGAFIDLLICDCLALAATRAVHLLPAETSVYAAAVKYLLPKLLTETTYDLSVVLGANFYVRGGEYGAFQKHVRDLPMISLGHAGTAACQATIIPQLPRLARAAWFTGPPAPDGLFRIRDPLPPLDPARLELVATADGLACSLAGAADELADDSRTGPGARTGAYGEALVALAGEVEAELRGLQEECAAMPAKDRTVLASPRAYAGADRYALLLAAAACLGVWRNQGTGQDAGGQTGPHAASTDFLASPVWPTVALTRLAKRLGRPLPKLPAGWEEHLLDEVLTRYHEARSYDLYDTPLAG